MEKMTRRKRLIFLLMLSSILIMAPFPCLLMGGEIPSAYEVGIGKAPLPTIEEFTDGKVKEGDIIDKNNMDLIKDLLTPGLTKCLEMGMKMIMGKNTLAPFEGTPPSYNELTRKYKGKAIIDDHMTVWLEKKGIRWPGGRPFPEPKTAAEVIVNKKFGYPGDDWHAIGDFVYVNEHGKKYKTQTYFIDFLWLQTRSTLLPHTIPGYENKLYQKLTCFISPIEARGLGGINIRYYDDVDNYDQGFYYHPAFKKTGRSNATTWMNNIGGSDITYGDGLCFQDPLCDWSFEFVGTKYVMQALLKTDRFLDDKGRPLIDIVYDRGYTFMRWKWAAIPMHVVECTPKIKHVYGRKTVYLSTVAYAYGPSLIPMIDCYDRQGKLWKVEYPSPGCIKKGKTDTGTYTYGTVQGLHMHDLQTGHTTHYLYDSTLNIGLKPSDVSLKRLLAKGR